MYGWISDTPKLTLQSISINGRSQVIELKYKMDFFTEIVSLSPLPKCCYYFVEKGMTKCKMGLVVRFK